MLSRFLRHSIIFSCFTAVAFSLAVCSSTVTSEPPPKSVPAKPFISAWTPTPPPKFVTEVLNREGHSIVIQWNEQHKFSNHCHPLDIARLITKFFDAFNRGNQNELATLFFGTGLRDGMTPGELFGAHAGKPDGTIFRTSELPELLTYFARRHQQHEKFTLRKLVVEGHTDEQDVGHSAGIYFELDQQADDWPVPSGKTHNKLGGKGLVDCQKQRFAAWGMGRIPE